MPDALVRFIEQYGYLAVAVIVTVEGLGIPVPGETALITAAAFAASGHLLLAGVIAASVAGTVVGGTGGYWIGRTGGAALLHRHGRWIHLGPERLAQAHRFFERHGARTVFVARFVALLRIAVGLLAGAAEMPFARFALYNALGGLAWSVAFGALGFVFGRNLPRLEQYLGRASLALALLGTLLAVVWIGGGRMVTDERTLWDRAAALWGWVATRLHFHRGDRAHGAPVASPLGVFNRGEYLLLHLVLGFAVSFGTLVVFALLARGTGADGGGALDPFDAALAEQLRALRSPGSDAVWRGVTRLGQTRVLAAIGLAVSLVFLLQRNWLPLAGWIAGIGGAAALERCLKLLVQRPRPAFATQSSFSYPSGHATLSVVGYGLLAYFVVLLLRGRWGRGVVIVLAAAATLAIGMSRLSLGAHFFSDVIGGFATGAVWLCACVTGLEVARRHGAAASKGR